MYKILVSGLAYDGGKSGISNYIDNVVSCLCENHKVDVLLLGEDAETFTRRNPKASLKLQPNWTGKPAINSFWHLFVLPFTIDFSEYDFVFLPAGNRRLFCRFPKWTVTTFHDLSQFHLGGKYDKLRTFYIFNVLRHFLRKVDSICAISKSTAADIKRFYGIDDDKIFVNYNGFELDRIKDKSVSKEDLEKDYGIGGKFLLYVARLEHPGKNHLNLIKAYEQLPREIQDKYSLVFAGSDWNGAEAVHRYAEASPAKERIKFCGFVDDAYLSALYRYSSLYVFPSFCEGFGLPMLEAFSAGVPVVCADRTSLPEIGADAVILFDPERSEQIAQSIVKVLTNRTLYDKLVLSGHKRAKEFDWHKHTKRIVKEYERSKTKQTGGQGQG